MNLSTKACGWLVALIWLACSAFGFFAVYFLLTFNLLVPQTLTQNFRAYRFAIVFRFFVGTAFLIGTIGVSLRRVWAREFSFVLCAVGLCYAVGQTFFAEVFDSMLEPIETIPFVVALLLISGWLVSRSGRAYFQRAAQPA